MSKKKKYKVVIKATYTVGMEVTAEDKDAAVDEVEKFLKAFDDYAVVNRASNRSIQIENLEELNVRKKRN